MPLLEKSGTRSKHYACRELHRLPVHPLQAMLEHWTIGFLKHVPTYFDRVIRSDREEEMVKSGMMQLA